jgi:hypothetical protein
MKPLSQFWQDWKSTHTVSLRVQGSVSAMPENPSDVNELVTEAKCLEFAQAVRRETLEEAAQIAEAYPNIGPGARCEIAAALRRKAQEESA